MDESFLVNNKSQDEKIVTCYTIFGKHDELDNDRNPIINQENDNAFAKKTVTPNKTRYFVKTGAYGKIYNPIGLYSEGTSAKFMAKTGKPAWQFKEVNNKIFDMYVSFLRTKNIAWLNNAEREMN